MRALTALALLSCALALGGDLAMGGTLPGRPTPAAPYPLRPAVLPRASGGERTRPPLLGLPPLAPATVRSFGSSLALGGNRLVVLHSDRTEDNAGNGNPDRDLEDGGWDWEVDSLAVAHTDSASPENTYGATAQGLMGAWNILRGWTYPPSHSFRTALEDTYEGMDDIPGVNSGGDFPFLVRLSQMTGDPKYAALAKSRYDAERALLGGAQAWADTIREWRARQGYENGIIPWDTNLITVSAAALNEYFPGQAYDADAIWLAQVIYNDMFNDDPGYFDETDTSEWWWTLGIAGALESFTVANVHQPERDDLYATLRDFQNPDADSSYWNWNGDYGGGDYQTTAYAMMAMMAYGGSEAEDAVGAAATWLRGVQRPNGTWRWPGWGEYSEEEGEVLWAISLLAPDLTVSAIPASGSVARGDTLRYTATVTNRTNQWRTFQFWAEVHKPDSTTVTVIPARTFTLMPLGRAMGTIKHRVPGGAPLGLFQYFTSIGPSRPTFDDKDGFDFQITTAGAPGQALSAAGRGLSQGIGSGGGEGNAEGWEVVEAHWEGDLLAGSVDPALPEGGLLAPNYPNPFNPSTTLTFVVPGDRPLPVNLALFGVRGKLVRLLVDEARDPGLHAVHWDGTGARGEQVGSGIYFARLRIGGRQETRKMTLMR